MLNNSCLSLLSLGIINKLLIFKGTNRVGDQGAKELGQALTINKTLTQLDLSNLCNNKLVYNKISNEGAIEIAIALTKNQYLLRLDLSYNNIGEAGCISMAELIKKNNRMTHLSLGTNI